MAVDRDRPDWSMEERVATLETQMTDTREKIRGFVDANTTDHREIRAAVSKILNVAWVILGGVVTGLILSALKDIRP